MHKRILKHRTAGTTQGRGKETTTDTDEKQSKQSRTHEQCENNAKLKAREQHKNAKTEP